MLNKIEIVDYKCFKNFSLDGFGRVNLIGGKNNIGKTVFLEACYIVLYSKNIDAFAASLISVKYMRNNINMLTKMMTGIIKEPIDLLKMINDYLQNTQSIAINSLDNNVEYKFLDNEGQKEYYFKVKDKKLKINVNSFSIYKNIHSNINFIDSFRWSDTELIEAYESIQKNDKEDYLNDQILKFDETITSFKIIGDKPQCKKEGNYYDLSDFGDGLKHYISIICALYACENGQLFIDEIDNGIHYTQLEAIWKIIFEVSKEVNCQVFATTHSI